MSSGHLAGINIKINPDGTVTIPVGGKEQLFAAADVADAVARKSELEALQTNMAQVSKKAQAMDGLDSLLAANPQASRLVNEIIRAAAEGRPLPGISTEDGGRGSESEAAPGAPEVLALRAQITGLQQKVAERERREQQQAEMADARSRLETFGFLKERPKLLEDALQSVVAQRELGKGDVPTLVRQVAQQKKEALEELLTQRVQDNNAAKKLEVEGGSGVPALSNTDQPVTKDSLSSGTLRERATAHLDSLLRGVTAKVVGS